MSENATVETTEATTTTAATDSATAPKPSDLAAKTTGATTETAGKSEWDQLPDDHPLVKTLAAQKEQIQNLKPKASRLDEIEAQRQKDEQTWQQRAEAAETALQLREKEKERDNLAKSVVEGTGFPASLLDGLDSEDKMRSRVEELKALKGTPQTAAPASVVANADTTPANQVQQLTQADLKTMSPAQVKAADAAGQLDALKGIKK